MQAVTFYAINEHADGSGRWWYPDMGFAPSADGCLSQDLRKLQEIVKREAGREGAEIDLYIIKFEATGVVMEMPAPFVCAEFIVGDQLADRLRARRGEPPLVRPPVPKALNRYSSPGDLHA